MTRAEIEKDYKVENGVIRSPGKFEGAPVCAPYYWDLALVGCADREEGDGEVDPIVSVFDLDASDVEIWPELAGVKTIRLYEDAQGFVRMDRGLC